MGGLNPPMTNASANRTRNHRERVMMASDYPHFDFEYSGTVEELQGHDIVILLSEGAARPTA
jgi:hypothetical protein